MPTTNFRMANAAVWLWRNYTRLFSAGLNASFKIYRPLGRVRFLGSRASYSAPRSLIRIRKEWQISLLMADLIAYGAIALVALSPLLHRFYMDRFWVHGRGTVIRLDGGINFSAGRGGGTWVWTPVIEYQAGGQQLSSTISYWQRLNANSKYAVGDEVDILYDPRNPSRVMLDSWTTHIVLSIVLSALIVAMLRGSR